MKYSVTGLWTGCALLLSIVLCLFVGRQQTIINDLRADLKEVAEPATCHRYGHQPGEQWTTFNAQYFCYWEPATQGEVKRYTYEDWKEQKGSVIWYGEPLIKNYAYH